MAPKLKGFIYKELFSVFYEHKGYISQKAFKIAVFLAQISQAKIERNSLSAFFKCLICSNDFNNLSDL